MNPTTQLETSPSTSTARYWMGVVSQSHVARGVAGGFAQLCHGKEAPLRKMNPGDWLIYYSPTVIMGEKTPLRAFTALGQVVDTRVYSCDMGGGFVPYRRDIRYEEVRSVPISALLGQLRLTANPRWGMALRRGHLSVTPEDFFLIAAAMRAK
jgi:hypothetical protein